MSRVGVKPITLPEKVTVKNDGGVVTVEGPKGKLAFTLPAGIELSNEDNKLTVTRTSETSRQLRALHGPPPAGSFTPLKLPTHLHADFTE